MAVSPTHTDDESFTLDEPALFRVGLTITSGELSFVEFSLEEDGGAVIFRLC
jgi:hypothetical protein